MDIMAIEMEDFEMILGQESLRLRKVAVIPHLESLMFMDPAHTILVKMTERRQSGKNQVVSALSMKKSAKKNNKEPMFLAALLGGWDELDGVTKTPVPPDVDEIILEFEDRMPEKLLTELPPRRAVDHRIEL